MRRVLSALRFSVRFVYHCACWPILFGIYLLDEDRRERAARDAGRMGDEP